MLSRKNNKKTTQKKCNTYHLIYLLKIQIYHFHFHIQYLHLPIYQIYVILVLVDVYDVFNVVYVVVDQMMVIIIKPPISTLSETIKETSNNKQQFKKNIARRHVHHILSSKLGNSWNRIVKLTYIQL